MLFTKEWLSIIGFQSQLCEAYILFVLTLQNTNLSRLLTLREHGLVQWWEHFTEIFEEVSKFLFTVLLLLFLSIKINDKSQIENAFSYFQRRNKPLIVWMT